MPSAELRPGKTVLIELSLSTSQKVALPGGKFANWRSLKSGVVAPFAGKLRQTPGSCETSASVHFIVVAVSVEGDPSGFTRRAMNLSELPGCSGSTRLPLGSQLS